jgi:hypothetical protein
MRGGGVQRQRREFLRASSENSCKYILAWSLRARCPGQYLSGTIATSRAPITSQHPLCRSACQPHIVPASITSLFSRSGMTFNASRGRVHACREHTEGASEYTCEPEGGVRDFWFELRLLVSGLQFLGLAFSLSISAHMHRDASLVGATRQTPDAPGTWHPRTWTATIIATITHPHVRTRFTHALALVARVLPKSFKFSSTEMANQKVLHTTDARDIKFRASHSLTDQDTLKVSLGNNALRPLGRLCVVITLPPC